MSYSGSEESGNFQECIDFTDTLEVDAGEEYRGGVAIKITVQISRPKLGRRYRRELVRYTDKYIGGIKTWINSDYGRAIRVIKTLRKMATIPFGLLVLFALYRAGNGVDFFSADAYGLAAFVLVIIAYTAKYFGAALSLASVILICNLLLRVKVDGISAKDVDAFVKHTKRFAKLAKKLDRGYIAIDQGEIVLCNSEGEPVRKMPIKKIRHLKLNISKMETVD